MSSPSLTPDEVRIEELEAEVAELKQTVTGYQNNLDSASEIISDYQAASDKNSEEIERLKDILDNVVRVMRDY